MYTEDLTIDTIDESELFGADNWQHNYAELAEQYLDGSENDDIVREAFPAIIAALAPLIPTIVQGVASLFNRPANNTAPNPPAPRPRTPRVTRPAPRPIPAPNPAVMPTIAPAPVASAGSNAANSLLGLLQNPQVLAAITALAQGITGAATGSTGATVPVGDIVNAIGGLAGQIGGAVAAPTGESSYLYNEFGERVESTNDPIEQANTITALLN